MENQNQSPGAEPEKRKNSESEEAKSPLVEKQSPDAENKMAPTPTEDGKILSDDPTTVKFIPANSHPQNGDAKIDIEKISVAFAGMGKEELMKFANDPFWVRLRWFLFIFFWLIWLAMLIGAIVIVVLAPKCQPPAPKSWWEKNPIYQVEVRSFKDEAGPAGSSQASEQDGVGDLKGMKSKLDYLSELGVNVLMSPIYKTDDAKSDNYAVRDYIKVDPLFGSIEDFKALVAAMTEKGLKLVMDFIPNHSSDQHEWFQKSVRREDNYTDYYVWRAGTRRTPPNNWLSVENVSAWEWNSERGEYYLHQFGKHEPDLNYRNPLVVEEMKNILKYWLELGVAGFCMRDVAHLVEDIAFMDEPALDYRNRYISLDHIYTVQQPETFDVLAEFRTVLDQYSGDTRILLTEADAEVADVMQYYGNASKPVAHFPLNFELIKQLKKGFTARDLENVTKKWQKETPSWGWPNWMVGSDEVTRVATRFGTELVDAMNMVILLMPGTPMTYYGEEIGMTDNYGDSIPQQSPMQWTNETNAGFSNKFPWENVNSNYIDINVRSQQSQKISHLKVYKTLVQTRTEEGYKAIMYGETDIQVVKDTVFCYSRVKKGTPGYLVAVNLGPAVTADFTSLKGVASDGTVVTHSTHAVKESTEIRAKVPLNAVPLNPNEGIVLKFVPNLD